MNELAIEHIVNMPSTLTKIYGLDSPQRSNYAMLIYASCALILDLIKSFMYSLYENTAYMYLKADKMHSFLLH